MEDQKKSQNKTKKTKTVRKEKQEPNNGLNSKTEHPQPKPAISDIEVAKKLINIYQSAQDRKLQFNLSFEYVRRLLEYKTCYYTNKPFTEDGPCARSFDRVDSDKGYVEGNVVACTIDINGKKSNLSFEEISCLYNKLSTKKEKDSANQKATRKEEPKPENKPSQAAAKKSNSEDKFQDDFTFSIDEKEDSRKESKESA